MTLNQPTEPFPVNYNVWVVHKDKNSPLFLCLALWFFTKWSLAFFERSVCNLLTEWLLKTVRTFEYEWSLLHVWCGTDSVVWSCNSWLLSLAVSHCCAFVNQLGDSRQSFGSQRHVVGASSKSMKAVKATARLGSIVSRYTSARAHQRNWFIHIWEGFCMYITDRISFSVLKNSEWWIIALRVRDVS